MNNPKFLKLVGVLAVSIYLVCTHPLWAGPVILGGDDLTDHGSRLNGANIEGWLYIENAIKDLLTTVTRPGPYTVDIVALGSSGGEAGCPGGDTTGLPLDIPHPPGTNTQNAGTAICSVAEVLGLTINFFNGTDRLNLFFDELAARTINPAVIWIAGTGADNDVNATDAAVLNANALAINGFVLSGGGLMAHGSGPNAYGWLSTLLPGLVENGGGELGEDCDSTTLTLTPAGRAAFPTLTDSDIQAGPCHSNFTGDLGGLDVLAVDGQNRNIIIGGGIGTKIIPSLVLADIRPTSCPNPVVVNQQGGVIPVAILGTADFDVSRVNPSSIRLEGVAPVKWSVKDVATPFIGALNDAFDCNVLGPDGFADLNLKFNNNEVVAAIGPVNDGDVLLLTLSGELDDGSPIDAVDVVVIRNE